MEYWYFMARAAEQAERFDDMVDFLKDFIYYKNTDFSTEERNFISVGFKKLIEGKRTALKTIAAIEQNPKYSKFSHGLFKYKKRIEDEMYTQSLECVKLLKEQCLKLTTNSESKVFFLKMAGDQLRYAAESAQGEKLNAIKRGV